MLFRVLWLQNALKSNSYHVTSTYSGSSSDYITSPSSTHIPSHYDEENCVELILLGRRRFD